MRLSQFDFLSFAGRDILNYRKGADTLGHAGENF